MDLHERLVAKQTDEELRRKRIKALRRSIWTQEEIDFADRLADRYMEFFNHDNHIDK